MKKLFLKAMMGIVALIFVVSFNACNMSGSKNASENKSSDSTMNTTNDNSTNNATADTTKKEKTDAPSPKHDQQNNGQGQNMNQGDNTKQGTSKEKTNSPSVNQQNTKQGTTGQGWDVPDAAKNKKNPVKMTADSKENGKSLYGKHCASCHGKSGAGDGPRSATLKTKMTDFKSTAFQSQSEGAIFYKTSEGKGEMPAYKKKLGENEIWDIVNYIKSFK